MNASSQFHYCILSAITFFPCLGTLLLLALPRGAFRAARWVALGASLAPTILAARVLVGFDATLGGFQFVTKIPWIPSIGVDYHVGVDGLGLAMVMLVSFLTPLVILGSNGRISGLDRNPMAGRSFFALVLLEQTGLYGTFTALNFFHWFIYWEVSLVPMFFLIKLFGNEQRTRASYLFFVYTFVGSLAMLLGMQLIYLATGTWDFEDLARMGRTVTADGGSLLESHLRALAGLSGSEFLARHAMSAIFLMVFLGFAVKVPLWPFHTWLPDSYTQAPTSGSMLMTGLMSKMGLYGLLRLVLPLFGSQVVHHAHLLKALAVATILLGAWAALAQKDLKTLVAYSSVSHLGYCLLGIFAAGAAAGHSADRALAINGVIFQMLAHGVAAAGLFYGAGLLEQRTGTRDWTSLGGLRQSAPVLCGLMGFVIFASLGLPGLAGFVGEFMIFRGAFPLSAVASSVAALGLLLGAAYLLRMTGRVFFGPQHARWTSMPDLDLRERMVIGSFAIALLVAGIFPGPLVHLAGAAAVQLTRGL